MAGKGNGETMLPAHRGIGHNYGDGDDFPPNPVALKRVLEEKAKREQSTTAGGSDAGNTDKPTK